MKNPSKTSTFRPNYHFVTGRLAEYSLRQIVEVISRKTGFDYTIGVMPITVAALITPQWLRRHLNVPEGTTEVILPGYCERGIEEISTELDCPVRCGPKDLRELPKFFSISSEKLSLDDYNIEIVAEINHAPDLKLGAILKCAKDLKQRGADIIDLGCNPGESWSEISQVVETLCEESLQVSIDTLDPQQAALACEAGAELVLSVNSSNRDAAVDWNTEVVAIPDTPDDMKSLHETIEHLAKHKVPLRIDPILEPIGLGFAKSLQRYIETRQRYPDAKMMMGIGNLTELTDVDSAGVNFLLLGLCQELRIDSVLTTEVINWARSSVTECDLARRMTYQAFTNRVPPKNMSDALVMLRDARLSTYPEGAFEQLADQIKDNNYRLFAQNENIHLVSSGINIVGQDPFEIFATLMNHKHSKNVDPSHAFYLGFEMCKALTAVTLGKQYEQDESLRWGHLTVKEKHHRLSGKRRPNPPTS